MQKVTEYKDIIMESIATIWFEITKIFPSVIGALIILIIGWLITKIVIKILKKGLKLIKANKLDDILNDIEIVEGRQLNFNTIKIVTTFVKWVIYVMLIIMVSDILNLTMISEQISNLLGYLPQLFSAFVIFTIGLILANAIKKAIKSFFDSMDMSGGKIISQVVFFIILTFISITALNQAGIDTEIITSNITMILAAFLLAFSLAFGFGAQRVVGDLLKTFYARKTYEVGQKIEFNGMEGEIETINSISVTLKTSKGKFVIPIKDIVESQIKIQD